VAANVVPAAGEASSAPSNPSPGFEGALRGAETEEKGIRERWEKERKERAGRDGRTPPLKMDFCLRPCMYMNVVMVGCASCRMRGY